MSDMLRAPMTSTPVDPFSGRPLGPPVKIDNRIPAEYDNIPVPDGTMTEVLEWVEDSTERAAAATLEELGRETPRPSLLRLLRKVGK